MHLFKMQQKSASFRDKTIVCYKQIGMLCFWFRRHCYTSHYLSFLSALSGTLMTMLTMMRRWRSRSIKARLVRVGFGRKIRVIIQPKSLPTASIMMTQWYIMNEILKELLSKYLAAELVDDNDESDEYECDDFSLIPSSMISPAFGKLHMNGLEFSQYFTLFIFATGLSRSPVDKLEISLLFCLISPTPWSSHHFHFHILFARSQPHFNLISYLPNWCFYHFHFLFALSQPRLLLVVNFHPHFLFLLSDISHSLIL